MNEAAKGAVGLVVALLVAIPIAIVAMIGGTIIDCDPAGGNSSDEPSGGNPGQRTWPMKKGTYNLSSGFGMRGGVPHQGIDLGSQPGVPIYAAYDGVVEQAGPASGFGEWIILRHNIGGKRVDTVYGHMFPQDLLVKENAKVVAGQQIARVGYNGQVSPPGPGGAHLHFEVWDGGRFSGTAIDPQPWLNGASEPGQARSSGAIRNMAAVVPHTEEPSSETPATEAPAARPAAGEPLPEAVPEPWRSLINEAAAKHPDSDRRIVAATLWAENRGWPEYRKNGWATSSAAAKGPWQFIPSSWASMGYDGDGDGVKDPGNPEDAVHAAFNHSPGSAGLPVIYGETGNPAVDYPTKPFYRHNPAKKSLLTYMANYNGNDGTAVEGAVLPNFARGQNGDYVRMGYWLMATNFERGWLPESNQIVDAKTKKSLGNRLPSAGSITGNQCGESSSEGSGSAAPNGSWVYYSQHDPRWQVDGLPIAEAGCGPTSIAMILASTVDSSITPPVVAKYAVEKGGWGAEGLSWSFFDQIEPKWKVPVRSIGTDYAAAVAALKNGKKLVLSGDGGFPPPFCPCPGGHIVAARGVTDDGKIVVANPAPNLKGPNGTPDNSAFATPIPGLKNMWVFG